MVLVLVAGAVGALLLAHLAGRAGVMARAQTAADAAALAGAPALDRVSDVLGPDATAAVRLLGPRGSGGIEMPRHHAARLAALSHLTGLCRAVDGRPLHFVLCPAIHRQ